MPTVGVVAGTTARDVRRLEAAGATSLWVGGHVASPNPSPEPLVWLARLVEQTALPVGTATLLLPLHRPAVLAKQLADLDRASGGRITLGVGVGGEYDADFRATGVPRSERGSRADEALGLLRRFWTAEAVTHRGRHFQYDDVRIHPAPAQGDALPIVVTGRREAAMRRAARLGDGWMPYLYSPEAYARSVASIRDQAAVAGRSLDGFRWMAYVPVAVDDDAAVAKGRAAEFLGGMYRQDMAMVVDRVTASGTAEDVRVRLVAFVAAGADHLVLLPCDRDPTTATERVFGEVVPHLGECI